MLFEEKIIKAMDIEKRYRENHIDSQIYNASPEIIAACMYFGADVVQKIVNDYIGIVAGEEERVQADALRKSGDGFA